LKRGGIEAQGPEKKKGGGVIDEGKMTVNLAGKKCGADTLP